MYIKATTSEAVVGMYDPSSDGYDYTELTEAELKEMEAIYIARLEQFKSVSPKHIIYHGTIQDEVLIKYMDMVYGPNEYTIYALLLPCNSTARQDYINSQLDGRKNVKWIDMRSRVCYGGINKNTCQWGGYTEALQGELACYTKEIEALQQIPGLCVARCEQQRFYDIEKSECVNGFITYIDNGHYVTKVKATGEVRINLWPAEGFATKVWRLAGRKIQKTDYSRCVSCFDDITSTADEQYKRILEY